MIQVKANAFGDPRRGAWRSRWRCLNPGTGPRSAKRSGRDWISSK